MNVLVQEIFTHHDSRTRPPSYSRISQIPEVRGFGGSWLWVFTNSRLQGLAGSRFRAMARSQLWDIESLGVQSTAHSRLRDFVSSRLQIFVSSLPLKTCITHFINLDFRGWRVFLNSPTHANIPMAHKLLSNHDTLWWLEPYSGYTCYTNGVYASC
jgi:hypothetical protein